ncbi:MAG: hypothetical protein AABY26_06170, partial [Nanoarchaeota archaeon]
MNKTELQCMLDKIEHEASSPTIPTIDDCIRVLANYHKVMEQERPVFPESEFPGVNKFYQDYLTWKFSLVFDKVGKVQPEKVIEGYKALVKLNENNFDFNHVKDEFSPFSCLAELYIVVGNQREAEKYLVQEKYRVARLEESEDFFRSGVDEHRNSNFESAAARYRECLQINPYHTKARVLLGFLHSTSVDLEELFQKSTTEKVICSEENYGDIPLAKISQRDNPKRIEINLGVNFQSQYYRKKNPEDLKILFLYDRFGESNNQVFKYVRDFSGELQKLMVDYSPLLKRSAFKFYRERPNGETELLPSELEKIGLKYFSKVKEINVPEREREREPASSEP